MKEYSFNKERFLGTKKNSSRIYDGLSKGLVYSPMNLIVKDVDRLMVVNFKGDPKYNGIELQIAKKNFGEGAVVLLYQLDGKVDVYYSGISNLFREMYLLSSSWEIVGEAEIDYSFKISEKGIKAYLKMSDRFSQVVEFGIEENSAKKDLENILAPLGAELDEPAFFPITYLKRFCPVNFEGTEIKIGIGGKEREPVVIPVKIDGQRKYLSRYSGDPLIGLWNRNFQGKVKGIRVELIEKTQCIFDGIQYTFVDNNGHHEILRIACESDNHKIYFEFTPPIPDLICLKEGSSIQGRFAGGVDENNGVIGGEYRVQRKLASISVKVEPTKGWQPPVPAPLWIKTYRWLAEMEIKDDEVIMESYWMRKKPMLHDLVQKIKRK